MFTAIREESRPGWKPTILLKRRLSLPCGLSVIFVDSCFGLLYVSLERKRPIAPVKGELLSASSSLLLPKSSGMISIR
jgi:hypothetical protein